MDTYSITGGATLSGSIAVSGAKNLALKLIPAALLTEEEVRIDNLPDIEDVRRELALLEELGVTVHRDISSVVMRAANISARSLSPEFAKKFRASIMFVGPLLARTGQAAFPHPGGCVIGAGSRPIDIFLDGFKKMGAEVTLQDDQYLLSATSLRGIEYFFYKVSVTATEALMMTATLAEGITTLKNCALEPEIGALADFLNSCGARISGAGTPTITIEGVSRLRGGEVTVMPDRIETGTFAIMAAASTSELTITRCVPEHIRALLALFDRIGITYEAGVDSLTVRATKTFSAHDAITHEYPGFATDLQSPYTVLMTQAEGTALIHETIYDRRLIFTDLLAQMGANIIMCDPHRVVVRGPTQLQGKTVISPDLRAGIAMVIAGMIAEGTTVIENIYQIERGYERIVERLQAIGVRIRKIQDTKR